MELIKLIDSKTLNEECNMVSCKVFTDEETGEVKKIACEYVPKEYKEKSKTNTPLFRSQH